MSQVRASAGTSHSPNGTSRIAPRQATAATDGRMTASIGTPTRPRQARPRRAGPAACPAASRRAAAPAHEPDERRLEQPRQPDHGDRDEGQVAPCRAVVHRRRWYAGRSRAIRPGPACRDPREQLGPRPRVEDGRRLDPCPAGLADPPADVVQLADVVRVRVDGERQPSPTARRARSTARSSRGGEPFISSAVPVRAASAKTVSQSRSRSSRWPILRPDGWAMTSTCGLRMALSVRRVSSARVWRRPTWTDATTRSNRASSSSS